MAAIHTHRRTLPPPNSDSDAQAYWVALAMNEGIIYYPSTAYQISGEAIKQGIFAFVAALKINGVWQNLLAIYPFIGGSAIRHAINARNPLADRLGFVGGVNHSATGGAWDGATGYAETQIIPANRLSQHSTHLSYYTASVATDPDRAGQAVIGAAEGFNSELFLGANRAGLAYYIEGDDPGAAVASGQTPERDVFIGSRTSATYQSIWRRTTQLAQSTAANLAPSLPDTNTISIGKGFTETYSIVPCMGASVGSGLTDPQIVAFATAWVALNTALFRA